MLGSCDARVVHAVHATGSGFLLRLVAVIQPVCDVMDIFFSHADPQFGQRQELTMQQFFKYIALMFLVSLFTACGGGGGSTGTPGGSLSPSNFLVNAPASLTLALGQSASYQISGGLPPYASNATDPGVGTAVVNGSTLTVGGYAIGETSITVSPAGGGASKTISLKVIPSTKPLAVQAPSSLALVPGNKVTYLVSGGVPDYRVVSSNPNVVVVSIGTGGITVEAKTVGDASISVYDSGGSQPVTLAAVVAPTGVLFTTAPSSLILAPNTSTEFTIGGGVAPFKATSSNLKVVNPDIVDTVLTLKTPVGSAGIATVVVTDSVGKTVSLLVTVSSTVIPLALSSDAVTIPVPLPEGARIRIIGGAAPFTVVSAIPAALGAVVQSTVAGGVTTYEVVLTPKLVSDVDVTVIDSDGKSAKVKVTINAGTTGIRLAPAALDISQNTAITLGVYGAVGDVRVFSSDLTMATATVAGSIVTVNTRAVAGTVTITVVDSVNSMATSVLTIQ